MITEQTALVLGAGASMPYDFPSGRSLLMNICKQISLGSDLQRVLLELGHTNEEIQSFAESLLLSNQPSVDAFLEYRKELVPLGKRAIAAGLIPFETKEVLQRPGKLKWYEYLFHQLISNKNDFGKNLSVITFNYDRSLEYFLFSSIKHAFGVDDIEASQLVRRIPVKHVYGQLGRTYFLGEGGRDYEPRVNSETVELAANEITIYSEGQAKFSNEHREVWKLLGIAKRVCFLGFGYHPLNVRRLQLGKYLANEPIIIGTAYHLERGERDSVKSLIPQIELGDIEDDNLGLLRKTGVLQLTTEMTTW